MGITSHDNTARPELGVGPLSRAPGLHLPTGHRRACPCCSRHLPDQGFVPSVPGALCLPHSPRPPDRPKQSCALHPQPPDLCGLPSPHHTRHLLVSLSHTQHLFPMTPLPILVTTLSIRTTLKPNGITFVSKLQKLAQLHRILLRQSIPSQSDSYCQQPPNNRNSRSDSLVSNSCEPVLPDLHAGWHRGAARP